MVERTSHEVPPSVLAFAQRLSPRVRAALPHWEWTWHPEWRFPREELQRRLTEKGIPEWPFLWPLEEAFAGVEVRLMGRDLTFGITAELPHSDRKQLIDEHDQIRFVPIAGWGDDALLLDATGRMYLREETGVLGAIDLSFESFLESQAMSTSFIDWSPNTFSTYFSPRTVATALAADRGAPAVVEASNEFHRWWRNDSLTLFEWGDKDTLGALWAKTLVDLVAAIDAAALICPAIELQPLASRDGADIEELYMEEVQARAPGVETLRARAGARRFPLVGKPSIYEGKPPSTGDVWISGEGESLRIDVLERREGNVVNYWQLTPGGSHSLLMSRYARG